ncbi:GNAT family N-acetyltransferase [Massilia consociata]|uniref:GNAT family N-acetyltransferase n=1 Tax=Massilia consociata TaxID=760117 RepID=A0ABV6FBL2_9BURK
MKWRTVPAARFAEHAQTWQTLHAATGASALLSPDFVAPLLAEFGTGAELLAYCEHAGAVAAMAIVVPSGRGSWASFQPSQAPLGLWLQRPELPLEALLAGLVRALPGFPLVFGLTQMDPALMPRPADSPSLRTLDYIDTARVTIHGSFEAYWTARGKNLRSNLKKQRARLDKEGVPLRLQLSRDAGDMAQAVADYGRLEGSGWKAGCGTAVDASNAQGRYYRRMLENFCARGAGCVYRYFFGEQLVAMDLCIEDGDSIIVLKTSYDESVPANLSPTLLMREAACRQLFDEGKYTRLEFYGRVMEWHLRWTDEVRTMYHVNYYRWPGLRRLHTMLASRPPARAATQ